MRKTCFGHPTLEDTIEVFGTLEILLDGTECGIDPDTPAFVMVEQGQEFNGYYLGNGRYGIRFVPKEVRDWHYVIHSAIPELDGQSGAFRSVPENPQTRKPEAGNLTQWWSDVLGPAQAEGVHMGAKTVSCWRRDFLDDFARRLERCL